MHGVPYKIWDRTTKGRKLGIRGEGDVPALLLVHSSNDGLDDDVRCKRRIEELDELLGEWASIGKVFGLAEHLGLDHSRAHKSCADVWNLVMLGELVPKGFMQGNRSSFGSTVI